MKKPVAKKSNPVDIKKRSSALFSKIRSLIESSKAKVAVSVNRELTLMYWQIGFQIQHEILKSKRASYGKQIVVTLSQQLAEKYGKGWSKKHLRHCLRSAETFSEEQIMHTLRAQLPLRHQSTKLHEKNKWKTQ